MQLAALLMLRNEAEHIGKTLDSLPPEIEVVVLNDTGSTDETIKVVSDHCLAAGRRLVCQSNTWENFAVNRNQLWQMVPEGVTHLLLLDASDEVRNFTASWQAQLAVETAAGITEWMVEQQWWQGSTLLRYRNNRMVLNLPGWQWTGRVHEALSHPEGQKTKHWNGFTLWQDRTKAGGSSRQRWERDLALLQEEVEADPGNTRAAFYLAQTLACLGCTKQACIAYRRRLALQGFDEERFQSALYVAQHGKDQTVQMAHTALSICYRAEPLVLLAKHHRLRKEFNQAYLYASAACELGLPECLLWFDQRVYDYERWHELSIAAWYCRFREARAKGLAACRVAIAAEGREIDIQNLKWYSEA